MNMKVTKDSDYVGCVVGLYNATTDKVKIVGYLKERLRFTELLNKILVMHDLYAQFDIPIMHIVEEKANGTAVLEVMREKIAGFISYDPGNQDKVTRMKLVTPYIESGNVVLPSTDTRIAPVPWANDLLTDLLKFPFIEHDDVPDAFSQLLTKIFVGKRKKKEYRIF